MELTLPSRNIYAKGYIVALADGSSLLKRTPVSYKSSSAKDITHVVRQGDTLYAIAYKYYRDDQWWHVLGDVNSIYDPFTLTAGTELLVPDLDIIKALRV